MAIEIIYRQVPISESTCCICHRKLIWSKVGSILLYKPFEEPRLIYESMKYCDQCKLSYLTKSDIQRINNKNKPFFVSSFEPEDGDNIKNLKSHVQKYAPGFQPQKNKDRKDGSSAKKEKYCGYQKYKRTPRTGNAEFFLCNISYKSCPVCSARLRDVLWDIPVSEEDCVKVPCKTCFKHCFFVPSIDLQNIVSNNPHVDKVNMRYYVRELEKYNKCFNERAKDGLMLVLNDVQTNEKLCLAIGYENKTIKDDYHSISIRLNTQARDILTAIYKYNEYIIRYQGKQYQVLETKTKDFEQDLKIPELIQNEITIGKGGGLYNSKKADTQVLVDTLIFSPKTGRYEIAHASYEDGELYFDFTVYMRFCERYGNPGLFVCSRSSRYSRNDYVDELNEQSFYYECGYNARKSISERRRILSFLIDLEIKQPKEIIEFLRWLINSGLHKNHPDALRVWESDIEFIMDYKVNPQRFTILG